MQDMHLDTSHTTQAAAVVAAAPQDMLQLQRRSKRSRNQQLQQRDMLGGDAGSGTDAAPQVGRKRAAPDSMLQSSEIKRTKADSKGSHVTQQADTSRGFHAAAR